MDAVITPVGHRPTPYPAPAPDAELPPLARALRHLLRRHGDYPAVWRSSKFAAAVDIHRRDGPARAVDGDPWAPGEDAFRLAVLLLGADPSAVASGIGYLEAALGHPLPHWPGLLRAGDVARQSETEVGTWFG